MEWCPSDPIKGHLKEAENPFGCDHRTHNATDSSQQGSTMNAQQIPVTGDGQCNNEYTLVSYSDYLYCPPAAYSSPTSVEFFFSLVYGAPTGPPTTLCEGEGHATYRLWVPAQTSSPRHMAVSASMLQDRRACSISNLKRGLSEENRFSMSRARVGQTVTDPGNS